VRAGRLLLPLIGVAGLAVSSDPGASTDAERLRALPESERAWVTEFAAPILLPEERRVFLELTEPYQRDAFKEDFWARRERPGLPPPLGPGYRERYAELRARVDELYDGWRSDGGRMVLRWGEPDALLVPACGTEEVFRDVEVWTYVRVEPPFRERVRYLFYRSLPRASRRLWMIGDGEKALFRMNSCGITGFSALALACDGAGRCVCREVCELVEAYREILARQGSAAGGAIESAKLFSPPPVSTEGLAGFRDRWAVSVKPGARAIAVEGPGGGGSRTTPTSTPMPTASASAQRTPTPVPTPLPTLSVDEVEARIRSLAPRYRDWLEVARPLMSPDELARFVQTSDAGRAAFMRDFWKSRS